MQSHPYSVDVERIYRQPFQEDQPRDDVSTPTVHTYTGQVPPSRRNAAVLIPRTPSLARTD